MRCTRAWRLVPLVTVCGTVLGCGGEKKAGAPSRSTPASPLEVCVAHALASPDLDGGFARCESIHVGTAWRNAAPDGGVAGRLPPELIQAVVRARFSDLRDCYEAGLRRKSDLGGRVEMMFVIDPTGRVASARAIKADLPDRDVVTCMEYAFGALRFPRPEGGKVTVVYPIVYSPGDS
ncbi:MAG: AgmX/PglI C-terminal domain-containing protein [Polyangiaceae bacterium]